MLLDIITCTDARLKQQSKKVTVFDSDLNTLIQNMFDSMYAANGIGLAAIQVAVPLRLFVIDIPQTTECPLVCINPVISQRSRDTMEYNEGCLSLPGINYTITRPRSIEFSYTDINNQKVNIIATDLLSICIQHELDHLDGILFIERAPRRAKKNITKLLEKNGLVMPIL